MTWADGESTASSVIIYSPRPQALSSVVGQPGLHEMYKTDDSEAEVACPEHPASTILDVTFPWVPVK